MVYSFPLPKRIRTYVGILLLSGVAFPVMSVFAQTSGVNGVHDPSRMIECNGKVYVYATGGGGISSSNGLVWSGAPGLQLQGWAQWVKDFAASNQGLWAPDGIYLNGLYYLYYSVCGQNYAGKNTAPCAIGLKTTPTLDTSASNYLLTDRGMVASNNATTTFGAIDPAPLLDASGNLWVVWGGGYTNATTADAIWVTRLDNTTGLPLTTDTAYKPPLSPGHPLLKSHKEGAYMYYHSGYYYLFWNTGGCCSGTASTYMIHVSRSQSITGPFTADSTFYASNTALNIHGPGHIGIYSCNGVERFTYHYYPGNQSVLGENSLTWRSNGWPQAGAQVTTPLKLPCATSPIAPSPQKNNVAEDLKNYLPVQKTAQGFRVFIAATGLAMTGELFNVQGKKIAAFKTTGGWNYLSNKTLLSGINFIRISSGKQQTTVVILNNP